MSSPLQASVIICVKNGQDFLRRQLDAVTAQVTNPRISYEIIVVDNGSTDGTPQVIQEWLKTVRANGLVKTFSQPHLKGIPTVRNFAAQQAEGNLLLFCDADDEVSDSWVQAYIDRSYDSETYSVGYCTKKIIRVASEIIHKFRKERTFNRRELSVLVASFGNLYGALFYSGKNRQPARELLPLSEV